MTRQRGPDLFSRGGDTPATSAESVSAFTDRLRSHLVRNFGDVVVRGEISEWQQASSGHVYFTLKDAGAQLRCIVWRSNVGRAVRERMRVGMEVVAEGRVDVYAPRGSYSLIVDRLEPVGRGDLHQRFEKLKEQLRSEGLFDAVRKRELPFLPRAVGVVTSAEGAALQDFLDTTLSRFPRAHVVVFPTRVQGDGAAQEVARALRALDVHPELDVLVVTRGGGSLEDLWAFNEEVVARAIHASRLPVVAAIGHETDFTIADMVADVRAKTPTEAGAMVVPDLADLEESLVSGLRQLTRETEKLLERLEYRLETLGSGRALGRPEEYVRTQGRALEHAAQSLVRAARSGVQRSHQPLVTAREKLYAVSPLRQVAFDAARLQDMGRRLERASAQRVERVREGFGRVVGLLEAHSPVRTLAKGYGVSVRAGATDPIVSVRGLREGERLETTWLDGRVVSRVEEVHARTPLVDAAEVMRDDADGTEDPLTT